MEPLFELFLMKRSGIKKASGESLAGRRAKDAIFEGESEH
jgi:hypothetical protein